MGAVGPQTAGSHVGPRTHCVRERGASGLRPDATPVKGDTADERRKTKDRSPRKRLGERRTSNAERPTSNGSPELRCSKLDVRCSTFLSPPITDNQSRFTSTFDVRRLPHLASRPSSDPPQADRPGIVPRRAERRRWSSVVQPAVSVSSPFPLRFRPGSAHSTVAYVGGVPAHRHVANAGPKTGPGY